MFYIFSHIKYINKIIRCDLILNIYGNLWQYKNKIHLDMIGSYLLTQIYFLSHTAQRFFSGNGLPLSMRIFVHALAHKPEDELGTTLFQS